MYNLEYYEKMLRQNSGTAEKINKIRWDFVAECNPKIVLDYGSGVGWFRAWRPEGVEVDTYDIATYPQTGQRYIAYDLVCFWDVLEHIPNFGIIFDILKEAKYVALSIPIKPDNVELVTWKHFKPGEHLHYFSEETLDLFFKIYGFIPIKKGYPECPPRQDILSVLYKKDNTATGTESWGYSNLHKGGRRPKRELSRMAD